MAAVPVAIAPAPANHSASSWSKDPPMPFACLTCTRRKVKCDKTAPACAACRKSHRECLYQAPPQRKRKRRNSDSLRARLDKYEAILKNNGLLEQSSEASSPTDDPKSLPSHTPSINGIQIDDPYGHPNHSASVTLDANKSGKIIVRRGKSRWVDSGLWRALAEEEVDVVSDEDSDDGSAGDGSDSDAQADAPESHPMDPLSATLLGGGRSMTRLLDLHPTYDQALAMWQTYVDYVEPVVKILHIPTTLQMIKRAAAGPATISKPVECLCFAVYHFAVVAMSDDECTARLGQPRSLLRARFHDALKCSFVNINFLRCTDLMIVQAWVLYCLSIRTTCDQQSFWLLTGIAVRLGQRIGLHRDGEDLGLRPFETQVRRRLFWQILPLDSLASQLTGIGLGIPADSWTTKPALNINDEDIWPNMVQAPEERVGATEMIFCLARSEIGRMHQKKGSKVGNWPRLWDPKEGRSSQELQNLVNELESTLESKYLRYCDILDPIHCLTQALTRCGCAVARLRICMHTFLDRNASPTMCIEKRQEILHHACKVLEYAATTVRSPILNRFRWHMDAFFTWDALVFALNELRQPTPLADPETVWPQIQDIVQCNSLFLNQKRALHIAIGTLMLRAWAACPSVSLGRNAPNNDPSFITSLKKSAKRRENKQLRSQKKHQDREQQQQQTQLQNQPPQSQTTPMDASSMFPSGPAAETFPFFYDGANSAETFPAGPTTFMSSEEMNAFLHYDNLDWSSWDQLFKDPDVFNPTSWTSQMPL